MNIKKIIIFINLFLLLSCGYEPIHSNKKINKNYNFTIEKIIFMNQININKVIKNNLKRYINLENKSKIYTLIIDSKIDKKITAKNKKGDADIFSMNVSVNIEIFENEILINKINFEKNFEYNNQSNKFNLKKYETTIQNDLASKIANDIILYLSTSI